MQSLNGTLLFSATDLSNFLACPHLTLLTRRTRLGGPAPREFSDPGIEVLRQRGREHEQNFLAVLRGDGARISDLSSLFDQGHGLARYELHAAKTVEAMKAGFDVIYQGFLFDGSWLGYPDFLRKVKWSIPSWRERPGPEHCFRSWSMPTCWRLFRAWFPSPSTSSWVVPKHRL